MRREVHTQWLVMVAGLAVLAMPGCSSKWLSGGTESSSADDVQKQGQMAAAPDGTSGESGSGSISERELGTDPDAVGSSAVSAEPDVAAGGFDRNSVGSQPGSSGSMSASGESSIPGGDESIPDLAMRGGSSRDQDAAIDGGALSGFDRLAPGQTPSEERISKGAISSRMLSSGAHDKRMAELRREEEAAIAAGFRDTFFGYDRASIEGESHESLAGNADWLKSHAGAKIKISGHCDERGTQDYNLVLGDKRAKAVKRYLVDLGIDSSRVATISFGKNRPFCAEHDESCYRQNRRGHFFLSEQ